MSNSEMRRAFNREWWVTVAAVSPLAAGFSLYHRLGLQDGTHCTLLICRWQGTKEGLWWWEGVPSGKKGWGRVRFFQGNREEIYRFRSPHRGAMWQAAWTVVHFHCVSPRVVRISAGCVAPGCEAPNWVLRSS